MTLGCILAALVLYVIYINVRDYIGERDGRWHSHSCDQVRRWQNGRWEYRPTTIEEATDETSRRAW